MQTLNDQNHRDETPEAPAASPAGTCPPWCDIKDHDGSMRHTGSVSVDMTFYPFTESGTPVTTRHYDDLTIHRVQIRDCEPAIAIALPGVLADYAGPDGLADTDEAILTFAEAQETAIALLVMAGQADSSPDYAASPGDPSPCCTGSVLDASVYGEAVFCPGCGSLYWQTA